MDVPARKHRPWPFGLWPIAGLLWFAVCLASRCHAAAPTTQAAPQPSATQPAVLQPNSPVPQPYDSSGYALGDFFALREALDARGISIIPHLVFDDSQNFHGGVREGNSPRVRFDVPISLDTQKAFGLEGGTFFVVYQLQHGGNASRLLTGDAQNINNSTDADNRSQIGQLWYEQKFFNDQFRIRVGKEDGNTDFDVLDNGAEFLNNSFSTAPTLGLLPSFPDNATAIQAFFDPHVQGHIGPGFLDQGGPYLGAGVFDGSQARSVRTGEYGPAHFLDSENDLFLIAETGARYRLYNGKTHLPGKISFGGWWDTNHFARLSGNGQQAGTGGFYFTWDQVLFKPPHEHAISAGPRANNEAEEEQKEYPDALAATFSANWADSSVNTIDGNLLLGLSYNGLVPGRDDDIVGLGATVAEFSDGAATREPYELAIESFYRIRFTPWVSLKPDVQYILHPSGAGPVAGGLIHDAVVGTVRLEMTF